jgi:hypothetical protein
VDPNYNLCEGGDATDLSDEAIPQDSFIRHRFVAGDLSTPGRYVGLYVIQGGFYAFVDEVEGLRQILKAEGQFGENSGTVADLMPVRLRLLETLAAAR